MRRFLILFGKSILVLFSIFVSLQICFAIITFFIVPRQNFNDNIVEPANKGNLKAMKRLEIAYREGLRRGGIYISKDEKQANYWKARIETVERNQGR